MYCASCGTSVTPGLSYCNRCGAELSADERNAKRASDLSPNSLIWAIVVVTVLGLFSIVGLMAAMNSSPSNMGPIMAFALMSLLLVILADSVFMWLLLGSKSRSTNRNERSLKAPETGALGGAQACALPEPSISITEHTTRTLEPVYRERKAE